MSVKKAESVIDDSQKSAALIEELYDRSPKKCYDYSGKEDYEFAVMDAVMFMFQVFADVSAEHESVKAITYLPYNVVIGIMNQWERVKSTVEITVKAQNHELKNAEEIENVFAEELKYWRK